LRSSRRTSAATSTLPPRLTRDAAATRMLATIERRGIRAPQAIERRHKAGLERLIEAMTGEYLDASRLAYLFRMLAG